MGLTFCSGTAMPSAVIRSPLMSARAFKRKSEVVLVGAAGPGLVGHLKTAFEASPSMRTYTVFAGERLPIEEAAVLLPSSAVMLTDDRRLAEARESSRTPAGGVRDELIFVTEIADIVGDGADGIRLGGGLDRDGHGPFVFGFLLETHDTLPPREKDEALAAAGGGTRGRRRG